MKTQAADVVRSRRVQLARSVPASCPGTFLAPILSLVVLALSGCATSGPSSAGASSSGRVDELDLVTAPVAVNLESKLGINGIETKVFAVDFRQPKTQAIKDGAIEVLMFEGLVGDSFDQTNRCRHVWSFPAHELAAFGVRSTVGTGYQLPLAWGKDQPRADKITIVARYLPPQGPTIYSAPSYISIPPPPSPLPVVRPPPAPASSQPAAVPEPKK